MEELARLYHDAADAIYDVDGRDLDLDLGLDLGLVRDDRVDDGTAARSSSEPAAEAESDVDEDVYMQDEEEETEDVDLDLVAEEEDDDWSSIPATFPANPVFVQPCLTEPGPVDPLPFDAQPFDFFSQLFPEEMFVLMVEQTNLYARQKQHAAGKVDKYWKEVSVADMKVFLAINILMGIHPLPEYSMYWSTDDRLRVPGIADIMGKSRYEKIMQYLHLNDSSQAVARGQEGHDPLFKVRPVIDNFREKAGSCYRPGPHLSVDEAMIAYTGRLHFKQYIKAKPTPWGIKVWCIADPTNGYMLDIDVYTGKINTPMPNGVGHHVVMKMASAYLDRYHHLYFDNYFAGVQLATDLLARRTYSCSTIRPTRKGWPVALNKVNTKAMAAGEIRMMTKGPLLATVWHDKRKVSILSTNAPAAITTAQRRIKGGTHTLNIPANVLDYNSHMLGVDLADQLRSYYSVGRAGTKWWRYIFWFIVQLSLVNSWNLFRAATRPQRSNARNNAQLKFRLDVCASLVAGNVFKGKRKVNLGAASAGLGSLLSSDHQCDRLYGRKAACKQCAKAGNKMKNGKTYETVFGCTICKIHLHKGQCFASFHHELAAGALVAGVNVDIPVGLTELEEEGWSSGIQMPDMSTLRPMSWLSTEDWKVGSVICDFESNNGDRDKTSTREMAKTQMQALESMGFTPMVSASVEFTLFYKDSIKPIPLHENVSSLLAILSLAFEQSGILVESVGLGLEPGKLQITMKEQPALLLADDLFRLHGAVRSICCKAGYDVTFMAKALPKISSNIVRLTWHLLDSQKRNVFFDVDEPLTPTALARHFLSGQIKHNKAISALARPTVNCYRDDLNTALNGIDKDGHCSLSKTTHVDKRKSAIKLFRDGDAWKFQDSMTTSASNPYLVVAAVLAAGIDGLNNKIELTDKESHCNKPALSLTDALKNLNEDTFMKDQLGALFVKRFLYVKTEFEIKRSQKSDFMNGNNAHPYSSPHHVDRELYLEYL